MDTPLSITKIAWGDVRFCYNAQYIQVTLNHKNQCSTNLKQKLMGLDFLVGVRI